MPIIMARIDDRLIHGQVTEGWGKHLHPDLYVVVSDEIAGAEWQSDICLAALPQALHGMVVALADAPRLITALADDPRRVFVLFESPHDAFSVIDGGAPIETVNIGGMHSTSGKREILDYIYVDDDDTAYLKQLAGRGVTLDFRDLPDHPPDDVLSRL